MMSHIPQDTAAERLATWLNGIHSEVAFWDRWFASKGGEWPEDYHARLDPMREIEPWIFGDMPSLEQAKVLDVGAGPMTKIGYVFAGQKIDLTACDPLAPFYDEIARKYGVVRPVETQIGFAEELSAFFEPRSFDLIHCCNALDHSFEPMRGIEEMMVVAKPAGRIILAHRPNEAEFEQYEGLHQWNFDGQDGDFITWNKSQRINATKALTPYADIVVSVTPVSILVILTKKAELPINLAERSRARLREILPATIMVFYRQSQQQNAALDAAAACADHVGANVVAELRQEVDKLKAREKALMADLAAAKESAARLEAIETSSTWRATAPLRGLLTSLRR